MTIIVENNCYLKLQQKYGERNMKKENIKYIFGQRIKKLRKEKGLSQEKLAYICGLHRTYISDVERGSRNISLENIYAISKALDISLKDLFDIE